MKLSNLILLVTVLWLLNLPTSIAASFDCAKAASPVEREICADEELSVLDDTLNRIFEAHRATLTTLEFSKLVTDQKKWLTARDLDCGNLKEIEDKRETGSAYNCIKQKYQDAISNLKKIKLNSSYGVIKYHLIDYGYEEPVNFISELFSDTVLKKGPLKSKLKPCQSDTEENCTLNPPRIDNTVLFEFGSGGYATGFTARYRSFLTTTDRGSGHFTVPSIALDFVVSVDRSVAPNQLSVSDITVLLTGIGALSNERLPYVEGLPKPGHGCIGCGD